LSQFWRLDVQNQGASMVEFHQGSISGERFLPGQLLCPYMVERERERALSLILLVRPPIQLD